MIDFIRLRYLDKDMIEDFVTNQDNFEELRAVLEYHSGEIKYPFTANIGSLEIRINDKSVYLKNSLHKFYNEWQGKKNQNYNDFTYSALCQTIDYLDNKLINLDTTRLTQLEFGLNIKLPIPAENIIKNNIIFHKLNIYSHNERFNGKGEYKQFNHSNYYLKIYDKAKQYNLNEHIIRFEIKFKSSKGFNVLGIYNIHDLKSKEILTRLFKELLKRFDELTIIDNVPSDSKMSDKDKTKLTTYLSYNYWKNLSLRNNRNIKGKEKRAFERLLVKNDLLKTRDFLKASLIQKFDELINN